MVPDLNKGVLSSGGAQGLSTKQSPPSSNVAACSHPRVSVGMPVFEAERFLRRSIESILAQDYPNFELLVSDNGSTDATSFICQEYARADERVRYHRHDANRGTAWNFNYVFEVASGPYFVWAADDDWRGPGFITACVSALESDPAAVLCASTGVNVGDVTGRISGIPAVKLAEPTAFQRVRRLVGSREGHNPCSLIYGVARTALLRLAMPFEPNWGEDALVLYRAACVGTFLHTDAATSYFRVREMGGPNPAERRGGILDPLQAVSGGGSVGIAFWKWLRVGSRGIARLPLTRLERTLLVLTLIANVLTHRGPYVELAYKLLGAAGLKTPLRARLR